MHTVCDCIIHASLSCVCLCEDQCYMSGHVCCIRGGSVSPRKLHGEDGGQNAHNEDRIICSLDIEQFQGNMIHLLQKLAQRGHCWKKKEFLQELTVDCQLCFAARKKKSSKQCYNLQKHGAHLSSRCCFLLKATVYERMSMREH